MKTKHSHSFDAMPRDYAELCRLFLPRPIHDQTGYENTVEIADVFAGHEDSMSDGQNDYFDLLCDLIEKYERYTVSAPKLKSLALLKHLVAEHGLSGADLSRLLGKSLPLGPMILRGERRITAAHAILLGKRFGLRPDAFIS
ncbi:helix-turn-helix domain-containing protein [Haloferula sp.]|uniref:helix-turn-helix domain-containing protein n=1 Tax=Haloferula sp. TaxID=2497595 RepID=UPI003C737573